MREIKFRAKVKYNGNHYFAGEWVIGHYHQNENGEHLIFDNEENYIENIGDFTRYEDVEIDETTLGQYTGLKDKNGKEIYEGDRLSMTDEAGENGVVTVGFERGGFIIFAGLPWRYIGTYDELKNNIEVIGNIHDSVIFMIRRTSK